MSSTKSFGVPSTRSAEALIQALQSMPNYKAKDANGTEARARVGSEFLFRMIGAGI